MSVVEIVVVKEPQTTVSSQITTQNTVITAPGPQGEPGLNGGSAMYFTRDFINSSNWIVNHDLGVKPNVSIIVGGEEVESDITHNSVNSLTVNFPGPQTGSVVCS